MDTEAHVIARYSDAARQPDEALCCATTYDPALLAGIPDEVLAIDYGCGDPTRHLAPGESVLDLGSGSGKHCFMASRVVGATGRVIGVDMNDDMLALARRAAPAFARHVGYANVSFHKARIQNLTVVANESIDVAISNCVLNLVSADDKRALFREIHRVIRPGGRAVISDIVSDRDVPAHLREDPVLWTGCVSGALREGAFVAGFIDAGFTSVEILDRGDPPWRTVEGIEFRSLTLAAYKGEPRVRVLAQTRSSCC